MPVTVELAQLFDCQQMPKKLCQLVCDVIFSDTSKQGYHEFLEITPDEQEFYPEDYLSAHKTLTKWLHENGYDPKYKCLINVWW